MLVSAFILGFLGSFHCLGMCSPLIMAVTNWRSPVFVNRVVYNIARISSYCIQGALISVFGSLFHFSEFQTLFSIIFGIVLIVVGFAGVTSFKLPLISYAMQRFSSFIKTMFSKFLATKTLLSIVVLGFLNGLLPCGLTYLALTYCIILPGAEGGFLFMLFFGMGTLPVMLGITSIAQFLVRKFSFNFQKFAVVALIAIGSLLVARGTWQHSRMPASSSIIVCLPK
jgi:sulfite exporter TauE/SafE